MEVIRWAVTGSFVLLAVMGVRLWWRNRRPATAWLSWMFVSLGTAILTTHLLPEQRAGVQAVIGIASAALVVAFPYLLFRFAESLRPVDRVWRSLATVVAAVTVAATVAASSVTALDGAEPAWYPLFVLGVLAVWTGFTGWVGWRLWSAGRRQPALTRRRMRTMALAAGLLNSALLLAGLGEAEAFEAAGQAAALASAVTFVLAFAPPRFMRAMWRQTDERALWHAEGDLVAADSREAVVLAVLPHVTGLLGGAGAVFVDRDGKETATGLDPAARDHVRGLLRDAAADQAGAKIAEGVVTVVLPQGRLGVVTTAYTPLFDKDELELIERLGALLDLALTRVEASITTAVLTAFEQGLIPQIDPPPRLLVDTRYQAGLARLQLGGDFMDVVALTDDAAAFVIGDVSGHGPAAAAFAVGIHAGWRTLAKVDPHNPSAWFAMLDEVFFDDRAERMCTILAGRIDIAQRTFTLASAGHYPPVVVGRDGYVVDVPPDPLLGIGYSERRKEHSVTLGEGQGLLVYTDGLLEQRKPDHEEQRWREEDLLAWLAGHETVDDLDLDELLWDFGRNLFADDVAIMLFRFAPPARGALRIGVPPTERW